MLVLLLCDLYLRDAFLDTAYIQRFTALYLYFPALLEVGQVMTVGASSFIILAQFIEEALMYKLPISSSSALSAKMDWFLQGNSSDI